MRLELPPRYRRGLALACILVLLAILVGREGLARWQAFAHWQALAESASALPRAPTLDAEALRQSATQQRLRLTVLEPQGDGWRLRGHLDDERHLQQWLQRLQDDGLHPAHWSLQRQTTQLAFDLVLLP